MSSPQTYIDTVKKEQVTWPTQYNDWYPVAQRTDTYFSGFFSSRAGTKKMVKDSSSTYHTLAYLLAQRVVNQKASEQDV